MVSSAVNKNGFCLSGSVLPTVLAVSVIILAGLAGLLALWEHERLLFAHQSRLRQSRADIESAYALYRLHPDRTELTDSIGYLLYDSVPSSKVRIMVRAWGLYELVEVSTADSLARAGRIFGVESDGQYTLYYPDNRSSVMLAGKTFLHGRLHLPENGLTYGRIESDFFCGEEISSTAIRRSEATMPAVNPDAKDCITRLFATAPDSYSLEFSDSLSISFLHDQTAVFRVGNVEVGNNLLRGNAVLYADELRIDSTCRIENLLICGRKIIVGRGARITAQIFAQDTVLVEPRAELDYPSGIYSQGYAEVGAKAVVNGYIIVCDTVRREPMTANYRQSRTARVRGLIWVDGTAEIQGIVAGSMITRQAAYFSEGYYLDCFYQTTLLENPQTAHPVWVAAQTVRRKEAVCVN